MTAPKLRNIHATAVVVGERGLLFVGKSGSGKSSRAFACIDAATRSGLFSALVADDRVLVTGIAGRVVAEAPAAIAGRMELRGSGIVAMPFLPKAVMHLAIAAAPPGAPPRLPLDDERYEIEGIGVLPLIRLAAPSADLGWLQLLQRNLFTR